jgi:hypothetical protein
MHKKTDKQTCPKGSWSNVTQVLNEQRAKSLHDPKAPIYIYEPLLLSSYRCRCGIRYLTQELKQTKVCYRCSLLIDSRKIEQLACFRRVGLKQYTDINGHEVTYALPKQDTDAFTTTKSNRVDFAKSLPDKKTQNPEVVKLLELFKTGNVPETVADTKHPTLEVPSCKWSLKNQLIQRLHGTLDARGIKQWEKVGRKIKPGAKSINIYAPTPVKTYRCSCGEVYKNGELKNLTHCKKCKWLIKGKDIHTKLYYRNIPVFAVEDTQGESLAYENLPIPKHRFMAVAEYWGLDIKSEGFKGYALGSYNAKHKEIRLASPMERIFFHELAHAAHDRVGEHHTGQNTVQREIVAEFVAATLCYMDGKIGMLGNSYEYLKHYAQKVGKNVEHAVLLLLSDIDKVISEILSAEKELSSIEKHIDSFDLEDRGIIEAEFIADTINDKPYKMLTFAYKKRQTKLPEYCSAK